MNTLSNRKIFGICIITVGLMLLLLQVVVIPGLWTLTILLPGLLFIYLGIVQHPLSLPTLLTGTATTVTGLILLGQSITGYWETWSYLWTLYFVGGGLALIYAGNREGMPTLVTSGQIGLIGGIVMLLGFGFFFEVLVFGSLDFAYSSALIASIVILVGLYLLLSGSDKPKQKHDHLEKSKRMG